MTLRIAGNNELGPREEKYDTVGDTKFPTRVVEELNLTVGDLQNRARPAIHELPTGKHPFYSGNIIVKIRSDH